MSEYPSHSIMGNDDTQFLIELEDDVLKNEQLDTPFSRFSKKLDKPSLSEDAPALANYESPSSTGKSYLSFQFTTIQPLGDDRTLFIVRLHFHPTTNAKFENAIVDWEFLPTQVLNPPQTAPKVVLHAPRKSYGGITTEKDGPFGG